MKLDKNDHFHKRLKALRERRGMPLGKLAQTIGVPVSTYREWENGRSIQGAAPYPVIARALEVSLQELLTGELPSSQAQVLHLLDSSLQELAKLRHALTEIK